jgi:tetratricopeptide (TPR) repeat protein
MIPRARFRHAFLAAILAFSSVPLLGQQGTQTVSLVGQIKVARASFPARRIEVALETRGILVGQTYADNEGKFLFGSLLPNVYYVIIKETDFEPVRQQVEVRALAGNTVFANVTLIPKDNAKPEGRPNKDNTSGENPFIVDRSEFEKHYPRDAVKEFDKGNKDARKDAADDAIKHYKKTIALAPDFYVAHNNLGLMLLGKKDFSAAEEQFREVVRINSSFSQAYFNLGNTRLLTKRFDAAREAIQNGLQRRPDSDFGQFLLATVYSRMGNREQAEQIFQHVLVINPNMSKAHLELVNLYLQENKNSEAVAELKAFLKVSPEDPFAPKAREVLGRLEGQSVPKP